MRTWIAQAADDFILRLTHANGRSIIAHVEQLDEDAWYFSVYNGRDTILSSADGGCTALDWPIAMRACEAVIDVLLGRGEYQRPIFNLTRDQLMPRTAKEE